MRRWEIRGMGRRFSEMGRPVLRPDIGDGEKCHG